jgi:hypothetical protein
VDGVGYIQKLAARLHVVRVTELSSTLASIEATALSRLEIHERCE